MICHANDTLEKDDPLHVSRGAWQQAIFNGWWQAQIVLLARFGVDPLIWEDGQPGACRIGSLIRRDTSGWEIGEVWGGLDPLKVQSVSPVQILTR